MVLWDIPLWIMLLYLFIVGAVIGSFLNVCIYRMPPHESISGAWKALLYPPSRCGYCFHPIPLQDNIPILGWFLLGGRCRFCRRSYSFRYAGIELLNGLLFAFIYWCEIPAGYHATVTESCVYHELGPQGILGSAWMSPALMLNWRYLYHMILVEMLVVATFIDFDLQIIPDSITVPAMVAGVLGGTILGQVYLVPAWFERRDLMWLLNGALEGFGLKAATKWNPEMSGAWSTGVWVPQWLTVHPHWHGLLVSLAGLLVGGGIVLIVRTLGTWVLKQEAMGLGDVTLMAAIGSFLGWQASIMVFFLAPVLALVFVALRFFFRREREIPYGPYLSLATLIVIVGWKSLSPGAMRVFELGRALPFLAIFLCAMLLVSLFLVVGVKRVLGLEWAPPEETVEEWTSADQLTFQAATKGEWQQGGWVVPSWPGPLVARGELPRQAWRDAPHIQRSNGWQQSWQRRSPGR